MKKFTKIIAITLVMVLGILSFAACGSTLYGPKAGDDDYSKIVAATYGDEEIMLSEANYFLRKEQWGFEPIYWSFYTSYGYANPWEAPYDEYKTMGDYIKELVMTQLYQTRVLIDHASEYDLDYDKLDKEAIEKAAQEMFDSHEEAFFDYAPVTVEEITKWLTDNTLAYKVYEAVKDAADVSATAEETEVYTVSYVSFDNEEDAVSFHEKLKAGEEYDMVVEDGSLSSSEDHVLKVLGEDAEETPLYTNTHELKTGEYVLYKNEDDGKWYVAIVTNDDDEEATADKMEEVLEQKREDIFLGIYEKWVDDAPSFKTTKAWENLVLSDGTTIVPEEETESAEEVESAEEETESAEEEAESAEEETESAEEATEAAEEATESAE